MSRQFLSIIFSLLLFCPLCASAQALFGLKGGLNVSSIGGDAQGNSSKIGYHVGAFVDGKLSDKVHFQPELVYSNQGTQLSANSDGKAHYNYLTVPLLFKIYPESGFHFQIGPQIAFLTSANLTDGQNSVSVLNRLNGVDFSACLGMGYEFEGGLVISTRYNIGLNSTVSSLASSNQGFPASTNNPSYPNRVFQLSLGYIFGK